MIIEHDNVIYMSDIPDCRWDFNLRIRTSEKIQRQRYSDCIQDLPTEYDQ